MSRSLLPSVYPVWRNDRGYPGADDRDEGSRERWRVVGGYQSECEEGVPGEDRESKRDAKGCTGDGEGEAVCEEWVKAVDDGVHKKEFSRV